IGGSGVCLTIGVMSRSLSQTDPSLAWLFQFPISRHVLYVSKLAEYAISNLIGPLAVLLSAMLLWGFGASFGIGLVLSVAFGVASAVSVGAICLTLEMLLSQRCRRKVRGACISSAAAVASCGLMFAAFLSNASPTTRLFLGMSDNMPNFAFWNPLSLGVGTVQMSQGIGPLWWITPALIAVASAVCAVVLATSLTARGLASANDSVPLAARRASIEPAAEGWGSGLVWKELLQVRRQPEFLAQVFSAPIVIGFLLYIRNPDQFLKVTASDIGGLCASAFAAASYLLIIAGTSVLRTELRTLWFLQCQPRSLADSFRTKARIWGVISMAVGTTLLVGLAIFQPGQLGAIAKRAPFIIVDLWLIAEISFGLLALGSTVLNETTVQFKRLQWVVPMLICGQCGATIYRGAFWEQLTLLAVLGVLSMAVRQRQLTDLAWLSEPVENPPVRFDVMDALLALLAFLALRDAASGLLNQTVANVPLALGGGYIIAAVALWLITTIWMKRTGRQIAVPRMSGSKFRPVALGLAATCAVGLLWVGVLRHSNDAAMAQTNMKVPTTIGPGTAGNWVFLATLVLAAPIFEEWLFRGLLYRSLRRSWGLVTSVAISALLFTAIHPMASSVAVLGLGVATALVLERTGRLWPSMLVHIGYNTFIVALWNIPL
ncbi:MAG TPA: type II CAAX endopeptidase family protein, partial [Planctomycetaceae bacterium]|nr:type II CAAX endopeptidase family protein [Planctomycetaceae bacterium]